MHADAETPRGSESAKRVVVPKHHGASGDRPCRDKIEIKSLEGSLAAPQRTCRLKRTLLRTDYTSVSADREVKLAAC